jgi:hypothetical protein
MPVLLLAGVADCVALGCSNPQGLPPLIVVPLATCCDWPPPKLSPPKASRPEPDVRGAGCRGDVVAEKRERISFLLPLEGGAWDPAGDVGAACQSRSKSPPPPPAFFSAGLLAVVGDFADDCAEVGNAKAFGAVEGGSSSSEFCREAVTPVVACPGPASPPSKSMALGAGARLVRADADEEEASVLEEGAVVSAGGELPSSKMLGSEGGWPSFAHRFV